jgi:hypothetical protein
MLRFAVFIAATLAIGGGAPAANGLEGLVGAAAPHVPCQPLAKLKASLDAGARFASMTPGQFHFLEGVWVGSPTTPDGLPPGDGALLITRDGDKDGIVVWTRGSLACGPIPINERLIKMIGSIKTGPLDADGNEL